MKYLQSFGVWLLLSQVALGQGSIWFVNRAGISTTAAPGEVYAPVYREDPSDPTRRISGNTPTGVPSGNTSYNGAAFVAAGQGPTFVATLWGADSTAVAGNAAQNNLMFLANGTTTFGTTTSGSLAGIVNQPTAPAQVPGTFLDMDRGTFQMRVWDTRDGTISTWEQLILPENDGVLRGYSDLFTVPFPLGTTSPLSFPPYLQGLQSFNLFIVPEPSALTLLAISAACVIYLRTRNSARRRTT
jgi:hypothetical protein